MFCFIDVLSNRKLLSLILSKRGISALTAEDGLECLDQVKELGIDYFDVIFMDNTMPKMVDSYFCFINDRLQFIF
jgi:CheY-like chemotaxis protein